MGSFWINCWPKAFAAPVGAQRAPLLPFPHIGVSLAPLDTSSCIQDRPTPERKRMNDQKCSGLQCYFWPTRIADDVLCATAEDGNWRHFKANWTLKILLFCFNLWLQLSEVLHFVALWLNSYHLAEVIKFSQIRTGWFFWLVPPRKVLSMELVPPNRKKWPSTLVPPKTSWLK